MPEHWWEKPTNFVIGFVRRRLEKQYEHKLLEFAMKYPSIRRVYEELGKDITLDLVGGVIENFPDPKDTKTVQGKLLAALKYFALITPRELGRIFDEGRDIGVGPRGIGATPTSPAQVGALITQIAELDDPAEFLGWLGELNPRDRAFFWGEVSKWQPAERMVFMRDYDAIARNAVIRQLVPEMPAASAPTLEEGAARRTRAEAFMARATEILNPLTEAIRGITRRLNSDLAEKEEV